jgi:ABC-type polysaccharide/polyol phosphate transport system ATPase subunit
MPAPIISVENLSKRYLVGHRAERGAPFQYTALRDVVGREMRNAGRKALDVVRGRQVVQGDTVEEFWALKDVSFEVQEGEVLGIIGRNGAGKSTLLKILSRITEPTAGRVTLRGRVASLLEVGTGFHPELSGRENIYLNGAILGMSRTEIRKKFDEIVAFAEVERFLDTSVKRYSSGMYVRLAFAVAAHLEPEILIVDEVLAVGDAEFQKKCLGKMDEVSRREGRTVLFVSHNMEAVLKLCGHGILLDAGSIIEVGDMSTVVSNYMRKSFSGAAEVSLGTKPRRVGLPKRLRLSRASVIAPQENWSIPFGQRLSFDLWIDSEITINDAELGIGLFSARGYEIASWTNACSGEHLVTRPGLNVFRIEYDDLMLLPGQYSLGIGIRANQSGDFEDYVPEAIAFEIAVSPKSADINGRSFGGSLVPRVRLSRLQDALAVAVCGDIGESAG